MNKLILSGFSTILLLISLNTNTNAFQYDIWNSGISIQDANNIAEKNGRKLLEGRVRGGRYAELLNSKTYNSELLGYSIETTLFFTEKSNILHTISITWIGELSETNARSLQQKIYSILQKKYGKLEFSTSYGKNIYNTKDCTGTTEIFRFNDKDTKISLSYKVPCQWIILRYEDKKLSAMNLIEEKQLNDNRIEDSEKL